MQVMSRVIIIVLDSVGVGALPDAAKFGDEGSNTLGNTARAVGGLNLPNFTILGLGNIIDITGVPKNERHEAFYGKMAEVSAGKDTTTGHWEMMGLHLDKPFPTFPNGFPPGVIGPFEKATGRKVLGNKAASGTAIIDEFGEQHMKTGDLIVYTSADSVFQICAHENVVPIEELYKISEIARSILKGKYAVGRVIARPFIGKPGNFVRTHRRRDFSLKPPSKTVLDYLIESGYPVHAIGKINEIFANQGITSAVHTESNMHGVEMILKTMLEREKGLIFANLVDFDSKWGHRNDPEGYARGLEEVDARIPEILSSLKNDDVLFITADHGCDPTTPSTDHSREYVPILVYGRSLSKPKALGLRKTFSDLGKTVADILGVEAPVHGESFKDLTIYT